MTPDLHECAAEGCTHQIRKGLLMCLAHWRMVPKPLQAEVNRAWRAWNRAPIGRSVLARREYVQAVRHARAAVLEKEIKRQTRRDATGDTLTFE